MRLAVAMLAILTTGLLPLAFADPPPAPPAAQAQPAEAPPVAAQPPEAPPTQNVAAPAKTAPSAPDEQAQGQLLRNQGYSLTMVRGEPKYCRREIPLGSHLATVMRCVTVQEAELMAKEGRETTERIQRNTSGCLSGAAGGCGH